MNVHQFIVGKLSFSMECNPAKTLKDTLDNKKVLISEESFGTKREFCVHVLSYKLYRSFMMYQSFNFSRHEVVIIIASLKATFVFVDKLKNNTSTKMLFRSSRPIYGLKKGLLNVFEYFVIMICNNLYNVITDAKKIYCFIVCRKLYDIIMVWKIIEFPISNFIAVHCDSSLFSYWSYQDGTLLSKMTSIKIGAKVKQKMTVYLNENQQLYNKVM